MKMAEASGQIFLVALTVLASVAASPIYYVEEPVSLVNLITKLVMKSHFCD